MGFGTAFWKREMGVAYYGSWRWLGKTWLIPVYFFLLLWGFLRWYIIGTTYAMASGTKPPQSARLYLASVLLLSEELGKDGPQLQQIGYLILGRRCSGGLDSFFDEMNRRPPELLGGLAVQIRVVLGKLSINGQPKRERDEGLPTKKQSSYFSTPASFIALWYMLGCGLQTSGVLL